MSIRVLVVDDSRTMRDLVSATLRADPQIEVVGEAGDPYEARQAIKLLYPDVITLDVEMPNMDGIEFLDKIMRLRPTPVIMVSTLTQKGTEIYLRALEIGAFDCVAKPSPDDPHSFESLAEKVKAAAQSRWQTRRRPEPVAAAESPALAEAGFAPDGRVVAIGSSTGGVEALITILTQFPANCPPTIISQHMPATFTKGFAARLNRLCAPAIAEASDGAPLLPGHVYLAPGNWHLEVTGTKELRCRLSDAAPVNGHRPSVDVMFDSLLRQVGDRAIGVILTGMGRDGANGLLALRRRGADTIGQDEASCVVYGMPKVAFDIGAVSAQLPLDRIAGRLLQLANVQRRIRA
jgi:two-component system, chemotaxis family, protein-glutamate methylesterase/glutaminase